MLDDRLVYLVYSLLFMLVWAALLVARRDLRQPMLLMSIAIAPLGPLSEFWYLQDYWKPITITGTAAGIEDLIFGFAIGGIAFALYPALANQQLVKTNHATTHPSILLVFGASFFVCLFIGTSLLRINSIFTSVMAFWLTTVFILAQRPDLLKPAIISGLLSFVLFVTVYYVMRLMYPPLLQAWCTGCNPTGIVLIGVNLEELLWDASWGVCGGILYPALSGYAFVAQRVEKRRGAAETHP